MSDAIQTAIEHLDRLNPSEIQERLDALADEEKRLRLLMRLSRQRQKREPARPSSQSEGGPK